MLPVMKLGRQLILPTDELGPKSFRASYSKQFQAVSTHSAWNKGLSLSRSEHETVVGLVIQAR